MLHTLRFSAFSLLELRAGVKQDRPTDGKSSRLQRGAVQVIAALNALANKRQRDKKKKDESTPTGENKAANLTELETLDRCALDRVNEANTACPRPVLRRKRTPDGHHRRPCLIVILVLLLVLLHRVSSGRTLRGFRRGRVASRTSRLLLTVFRGIASGNLLTLRLLLDGLGIKCMGVRNKSVDPEVVVRPRTR